MAIVFGKVCPRHPELKGRRYSPPSRPTLTRCPACHDETCKRWVAERPGYTTKQVSQWRERNPGAANLVSKRWNERNPGVTNQASLRWARENPGKALAKVVRRHAAKLQRIPPWADLQKIASIYTKACKLGLTVDHAIPLQGKRVSGLHVETNLRLLSRLENSRKGNRFQLE